MAKSTKKTKERPLTGKQELFCTAMFTVGSQSFGNGTESARTAGYKGSDYTLGRQAHDNTRNHKLLKRKHEIQAEIAKIYKHNRDIAIKKLYADYELLQAKANTGDIQAIQARSGIIRELNAISSLHSQTIDMGEHIVPALTPEEQARANIIANNLLKTSG